MLTITIRKTIKDDSRIMTMSMTIIKSCRELQIKTSTVLLKMIRAKFKIRPFKNK